MTGALRTRAAFLAKLLELLVFPSSCRLCRALLDEPGERVVCRACLDKLVPRQGAICPACGRFLESAGGDHLCATCLEARPPFSLHRSCGAYGGTLKEVILLFKYRRAAPLSAPRVPAQAGLRASERERNVVGAYAVRRPEKVRGRAVVLVDDVTTTGATLRECARVLVEAGAREVRANTLAQA